MTCDRCGKLIESAGTDWGNCTACGCNLCAECAGGFDEEGQCAACADDALPCGGAESCPCGHESKCGACDHASMADCECCEATL